MSSNNVLRPYEHPATIRAALTPPQRIALVCALAAGGRLVRIRGRWRSPAGGPPVADATVDALMRGGHLLKIYDGGIRLRARLTCNGDWYARTLNSQAIARAGEAAS